MAGLILLVEDDITLGQTLKDFFECNDLSVIWAKDGEEGVLLFKETHPQLILLDVVLPYKDGFEVASTIRELNSIVPIIFMTGTALNIQDYINAYQLRAINYIEKPIIPQIALAQINSLLQPIFMKTYSLCNYTITIDNQILTINNQEFQLRDKDAQILSLLLENVDFTVTRGEILHTVWNDNRPQLNNSLDTSISHLKKVLKGFPLIRLQTIYGNGYKLSIGQTFKK